MCSLSVLIYYYAEINNFTFHNYTVRDLSNRRSLLPLGEEWEGLGTNRNGEIRIEEERGRKREEERERQIGRERE